VRLFVFLSRSLGFKSIHHAHPMGAKGSSDQRAWKLGGHIRDALGRDRLVRSATLARASRGLNGIVQAQRNVLADRAIAASDFTQPNALLRWAESTPGAGHAARRLYRGLVAPQDREMRAKWAREVRSRCQQVWPQEQNTEPEISMDARDVEDALANPRLIRTLVALQPDTAWLSELLDAALQDGNRVAVDMLLFDDPTRAPPSGYAIELAARHGDFDLALKLVELSYRPVDRAVGLGGVVGGLAQLPSGPRWPHADLQLVAPLVVAIVRGTQPMDLRSAVPSYLRSIGVAVAHAVDPAAFEQLLVDDDGSFEDVVCGAVSRTLYVAATSSTPESRAAAIARLQLWMVSDAGAAANAAHTAVARRHMRATIVASGLADMLHAAGFVEITDTDVIFTSPEYPESANGRIVMRAISPELDEWAATLQANAAQQGDADQVAEAAH